MAPVIALAACAAPPPNSVSTGFPAGLAEETFSKGFEQISERYIEALPIDRLALEGLRGLDSIDRTFKAELDDGRLFVEASGLQRYGFQTPQPDAIKGWAKLTTEAILYARSGSTEIGAAPPQKLVEAVFDGSLSLLDAYSRYAGADKAGENRAQRSGFGGIGIRIKVVPRGARVTMLFEESPAGVAGLLVDDIITHVDGNSLSDRTQKYIRDKVRGEIGTIADLVVARPDEGPKNYAVKRARIVPPTVILTQQNGILFVRVRSFNVRTSQQLTQKITHARKSLGAQARGIILDLRGNPGGILSQAIEVADLFLVKGKILSTRGRHPSSLHEYEARVNDIAAGLPMAVLINGRSASASEIVAAALQDHERAVVIGTSSFGKGSVQTVGRLPNDGELTLTWSRFITPSGYVLHGLGVPPFVCTAGDVGNAAALIAKALSQSTHLAETLEAWHSTAPSDKAGRRALKKACRGTNKKPKVDMEIATRLISDSALYRRVLTLSPFMASVGK